MYKPNLFLLRNLPNKPTIIKKNNFIQALILFHCSTNLQRLSRCQRFRLGLGIPLSSRDISNWRSKLIRAWSLIIKNFIPSRNWRLKFHFIQFSNLHQISFDRSSQLTTEKIRNLINLSIDDWIWSVIKDRWKCLIVDFSAILSDRIILSIIIGLCYLYLI